MKNEEKKLEFYGGEIGAVIPFIVMLALMIALVLTGHKSPQYYWSASISGLFSAYLLMKNKSEFGNVILRGIGNRMTAIVLTMLLFAGIFGKLLTVGGLANGILWGANQIGVSGVIFPVIIFLVSAILSTSMGTTPGTITAVTPIFFPAAVALGCNPAVFLGAIVGGSYFGDNMAPISDTTIVSATTQGTTVNLCIKTRLKYALVSAIGTIILTAIVSKLTVTSPSATVALEASNAKSLLLIVALVVMIILVIKGFDLVASLMISTVLGMIISLMEGLITFEQIYSTDGGIIVSGINGMLGVIIYAVFVFALNQFLKESGALDIMIEKISRICKTPCQTEFAVIILCICVSIMVPLNTIAMVICGPYVKELISRKNMHPTRGSNLFEGVCVSMSSLLPYTSGVMIAQSLAVESGCISSNFSTFDIIPFSFYGMFLILVFVISAITGWGRKYNDELELPQVNPEV